MALRVYVARRAAGDDAEMSPQARAGALLEASTAHEIRDLREMVRGALSKE